jgi:uncharacterized repeat protein (TIGR01451 family)
MVLTHGVRNLVLGTAVTAGALVVMHGVAGADEASVPPESPSPAESTNTPDERRTVVIAAAPASTPLRDQVQEGPPRTAAEDEEQLPPPPPIPAPVPVRASRATSGNTSNGGEPIKVKVIRAAITTPGPLTRVETSPDLNCSVRHAADNEPAFFGGNACGTFLAVGGTLFGPAQIPPLTTAPSPKMAFTPIRQSPVTGSGTAVDPYKVVTEVVAGASGLSVVQTDSYVSGQEAYRTDVTIVNDGPADSTVQLYRAGDCQTADSDDGFGTVHEPTGSVACLAADEPTPNNFVPGTRTQRWYPLSPGSHFYEDLFSIVWAWVGSQQPFPDACGACGVFADNGAGLSWEMVVPAGGSVTRSHLTVFSVTGALPLTIDTTPQSTTAVTGSVVSYRVVVSNLHNDLLVNLRSITHTLPPGFSYVPGSTSGFTNGEPTVNGRVLTWNLNERLSSEVVALEFDVRVSSVPGDYVHQTRADANPQVVVASTEGAAVTVTPIPNVEPTAPAVTVGGVALVRTASAAPLAPRAAAFTGATVLGTSIQRSGQLPATGIDPQGLLALGWGLLSAGSGLMGVSRRRRRA